MNNHFDNQKKKVPTRLSRSVGCMLGGAVGDSLGAAVEFLSLDQIRRRFGGFGITYIVGARYGTEVIPNEWLSDLEMKEVIKEVATDLLDQFIKE